MFSLLKYRCLQKLKLNRKAIIIGVLFSLLSGWQLRQAIDWPQRIRKEREKLFRGTTKSRPGSHLTTIRL